MDDEDSGKDEETTFKRDVMMFTINNSTEMVIDSRENETEITFIKEETSLAN